MWSPALRMVAIARCSAAMPLAVHRYGVVGGIADKIRLIVAHYETALLPQQSQQVVGQAAIAIVEKRYMPRPRLALEHRREAVQRDERGQAPGLPSARELSLDRIVVRPEDRAGAQGFVRIAQADIARNGRHLADFRYRASGIERPVAVDHQPRIILLDQCRIERVRKQPPESGNADIEGDVALPFRRGDAEPAERAGRGIAGMIGDQQKR